MLLRCPGPGGPQRVGVICLVRRCPNLVQALPHTLGQVRLSVQVHAGLQRVRQFAQLGDLLCCRVHVQRHFEQRVARQASDWGHRCFGHCREECGIRHDAINARSFILPPLEGGLGSPAFCVGSAVHYVHRVAHSLCCEQLFAHPSIPKLKSAQIMCGAFPNLAVYCVAAPHSRELTLGCPNAAYTTCKFKMDLPRAYARCTCSHRVEYHKS